MSHISIPIQNIYYLLSYAWNKLEESKIVAVDPIECSSALDLFAKVSEDPRIYDWYRSLGITIQAPKP